MILAGLSQRSPSGRLSTSVVWVSDVRRRVGASRRGDSTAGLPADQRKPGGLTRRLIAASGLLALTVGGTFVVLLLAFSDLHGVQRRSNHSREVLIAANGLERLLLDLDTGQRGFLLTHEERFLQPWTDARARFPASAAALLRLVAGDPVAERRAARIAQTRARVYQPVLRATRRRGTTRRPVGAQRVGRGRG